MEVKKKSLIAIVVLCVLHAVGVVGLSGPLRSYFLMLTPFNLLLSTVLILSFHKQRSKDFYSMIGLIFILGYAVEIIGVNTAYPFGQYSYSDVLGFKILDTPPMIGVNWLMLVYAASSALNEWFPKLQMAAKSALGASLLLLLDVLIEPVAIDLNFWTWGQSEIPIQNYISWWIIAFILHLICFKKIDQLSNKVAMVLLVLQFLFFGLLNFLI